MFKVGQKVVCVRGGRVTAGGFGYLGSTPIKGQTYDVAGYSPEVGADNSYGVLIRGLPNYGLGPYANTDFGWLEFRFRPLVELKDDIAMFKALLDQAAGKKRADHYRRRTQEIADNVG